MDSKENTPMPASKSEEPVPASKQEEHHTRDAIANHHASVISHLNNGDAQAAFQALMTDPNGRQLDYAESRMMYG
jgi:hypothetical protein